MGKVEKINGKTTDSIEFNLTKMPIVVYSLATGILTKTLKKVKKLKS